MKEKIVHLMKSEGLTSSRLAEILETQPSGISHIVSGRNKPSFDLLQKILRRFPRINPDWLLLDSDEMYRSDDSVAEDAFASREGEQSPIDLFDFGGPFGGGDLQNAGGNSAVENSNISGGGSTQNRAQNMAQNRAENMPQNSAKNAPQNAPQNGLRNQGKIGGQIAGQNGSQNLANFASSSPAVQRVIILYTDGTFRTYESR